MKKKSVLIPVIAVGAAVLIAGAFFLWAVLAHNSVVNEYNSAFSENYTAAERSDMIASAYDGINAFPAKLVAGKNLDEIKYGYIRFSLIPAGKYDDAISLIDTLKGYDEELIEDLYTDSVFKLTRPGSSVKFGRYEQDADASDGAEEISWIVLNYSDGKVLLLSEKVLGGSPFSKFSTDSDYASSDVNDWCEKEFYHSILMNDSLLREVIRSSSPDEGLDVHSFVLSQAEYDSYFAEGSPLAEFRNAVPAKATLLSKGNYWLRCDAENGKAMAAMTTGAADAFSVATNLGIRPCIVVNLSYFQGK